MVGETISPAFLNEEISRMERAHIDFCLTYEAEGWSSRTRCLAEKYAEMAECAGMKATAESWRSDLANIKHARRGG